MIYVLIILISLYSVLLMALIGGWLSVNAREKNPETIKNYYSILVPVRNEEANIAQLFHDLQCQKFPRNSFEVIFINDHSEDGTIKEIESLLTNSQVPARLVHLVGTEGKKAALRRGIEIAKGSVIVTTDADCRMSSSWLRTLCSYYECGPRAEMVCGPVTFGGGDTPFKSLQTIEFASLIGAGAASLALGIPNMCNGANLSFRKQSFTTVGGYAGNENIASGDDEFLMHKFYRKFPSRIYFNKSPEGIIYSKAHEHWSDFFQQRKRWASKWRLYTNPKTIVMAIFIFLVNVAIVGAMGLLVKDFYGNIGLLAPLVSKFILEGVFLLSVLKFLGKELNPFLFIFLQFTYPFYVILFGIAANFGKYTWKGRKH